MKWVIWILIILFSLVFLLFFIRLILPRQIDDVTPGIPCEDSLLKKSDVFYIIPKFKGDGISNHSEWCKKIKSMNKELAMHGVYHTYEEFKYPRNKEYVREGISEFEKCFGFKPKRFKPPQLAWTDENNWMKKEFSFDGFWNQLFHKVYHCQDTGTFSNKFIDWF